MTAAPQCEPAYARGGRAQVRAADVVLDLAAHTVRVGDAAPVALPRKELELLHVLMVSAGHPVPSAELKARLWPGLALASATLHSHIRRLRHRIETDPRRPRRIRTVRGPAYVFTDFADFADEPALRG